MPADHLVREMIITCKEATRLVSQGLDRHLGFGERLRLRIHLAICDGCTNFRNQVAWLRKGVQQLGSPGKGPYRT